MRQTARRDCASGTTSGRPSVCALHVGPREPGSAIGTACRRSFLTDLFGDDWLLVVGSSGSRGECIRCRGLPLPPRYRESTRLAAPGTLPATGPASTARRRTRAPSSARRPRSPCPARRASGLSRRPLRAGPGSGAHAISLVAVVGGATRPARHPRVSLRAKAAIPAAASWRAGRSTSSWMRPSNVRLSISSRSKSAAPRKIASIPV